MLGEIALVTGAPRTATAVAREDDRLRADLSRRRISTSGAHKFSEPSIKAAADPVGQRA